MDAGRRLTTGRGGGYFFFVIDSGTAEVTHDGAVLATFGPGDFFGESAIFETLRRTATVTTTSPATVLAMFGADFALLTDHIPELRKKIDAAISDRLATRQALTVRSAVAPVTAEAVHLAYIWRRHRASVHRVPLLRGIARFGSPANRSARELPARAAHR